MKSEAPLKTYGHPHKPYSVLPGMVNLLSSVLDDVVAKRGEGAPTVSTLQASIEKMEEVSCSLRPYASR